MRVGEHTDRYWTLRAQGQGQQTEKGPCAGKSEGAAISLFSQTVGCLCLALQKLLSRVLLKMSVDRNWPELGICRVQLNSTFNLSSQDFSPLYICLVQLGPKVQTES